MSLESTTEGLRAKAATSPPLGHTVRFDLGADGSIFWDGTGATAVVNNEAKDAECTLILSLDDLEALSSGGLDPTMAYMTGRLKIDGSMGVAMKIGQVLGG
ncbi:MAG: SCP2 sterol-binding domain-containing protein [Stellaceae bacterium]